ncbi:MAG: Tim44/TimA family putative adaptor protein [Pseudomonadota bacterium]
MIEVLILAAIALFVLSRLYVALGRDDGPPEGRPRVPQPGPAPDQSEPGDPTSIETFQQDTQEPHFTGPAAGGLEDIYRADNGFEPRGFVQGARAAYELIVEAFANGERDVLRPLLDDDVYEAWDAAIDARENAQTEPWRLLRLKKADIEDANLNDSMARVTVLYEADLGDGEKTRTSKELWTFMRDVTSENPNWILDDVNTAG